MLHASPASSFSSLSSVFGGSLYSCADDPRLQHVQDTQQTTIELIRLIRSVEFQWNRLLVSFDKESIPACVVRENDVELARRCIEHGIRPRIDASDVQFSSLEMRDLLAWSALRQELVTTNGHPRFWQAMDNDGSPAHCCHAHGPLGQHAHQHFIALEGNFLIAQGQVSQAIQIVFGDGFNLHNSIHRDHLFTLSALNKAQDQLSGGQDFTSQKSQDFNTRFHIVDSIKGRTIGSETRLMPDGGDYLIKKFDLHNLQKKMQLIIESESEKSQLQKARDIVNLGWKNIVDVFAGIAISAYKVCPSFAMCFLAFGTAGLILRSMNDQESADALRNNVGALAEFSAFFVWVNMVLENLSHSFVLAAPAFIVLGIYDKTYSQIKAAHDCFVGNAGKAGNASNQETPIELERDIEAGIELSLINGSFARADAEKVGSILRKVHALIHEEEMWIGLRKWQGAYADNPIENELKTAMQNLIGALNTNPASINALLQQDFNQALNDSHALLQAYAEAYQKKTPGSGINQLLHDFCDTFARDGILLAPPSENAKMAALYCRAHFGLMSFEARLQASLPHMPSGEQVVLAIAAIVVLFAGSAIYERATGHEETYTTYVTNFPDHLFKLLQLDALYANLGGGAEMTETFKRLFTGFNLFENSTHLGLVLAPLIAYLQIGSRMFEGLHHQPANFLAYIAHSLIYYADEAVKTFNPSPSNSSPSMSANVEERSDIVVNDDAANDDVPPGFVFCGSGADFLAQFQNQQAQQNLPGKTSASNKKQYRPVHQHGVNCKH